MQLPSPWGHELAGPSRPHLFWEDTHVLHTLYLQTQERKGWKSKLYFLSEMNFCLVPVLALLAYCPLRARNGLEASNRKEKKNPKTNKDSPGPFQPFSDAEVCCISSCFVLFLLQPKQDLLWTLKWLVCLLGAELATTGRQTWNIAQALGSLREATAVGCWFLLTSWGAGRHLLLAVYKGSFAPLYPQGICTDTFNVWCRKENHAVAHQILWGVRGWVRKMNVLLDIEWGWKTLAQFIVSYILNRELFSGLVLTLSLLSLCSPRDWFLAITSNISCLPSPEVLSCTVPIPSYLIFFW